MSNHKNLLSTNRGFTLVEMLIVAPMIILVIGVFIGAIISMTGEVMMTRGSSSVTYNIQDALDRIENDVKTSGAFLATNNIVLTTGQGFDNGTAAFQNTNATNGTMLILNSYATSNNPSTSPSRDVVYAANQPYACSDPQATQNKPVMLNIVYFVKDDTLWRRVIMPSNYATIGCSVPWQKPSCKPVTTQTGFCKADDIKLVEGVDSVSGLIVEYFQSPSSTTANSVASDYAQTDSIRQTALSTTNTVKVTIESITTVAGREVKRSGIVQAVAPNNNAKSLLITSQPSDVSINVGSNASFSATSSDDTGATVQWQQSVGKDVNWSNISGATSTTYTVTAATYLMDGYKYRAVFTKGSDIIYSNSARINVTDTDWHAIGTVSEPFKNGWTNYNNGYNTAAFRRTSSGVIILRGMVSGGVATAGTPIATLPTGYWPTPEGKLLFTTQHASGKGRVDVWPNGDIVCVSCSSTWQSLEGIHFIPSNGRYTENKISTLANNWTNYGSAHAPAAYIVDNANRVHLQGFVKPGITTSGTTIFKIPNNLLPSRYMHFPSYTYYVETHLSLDHRTGTEAVVSKVVQSTSESISTELMYYPASEDAGWTNLTLINSWVNYDINTYTSAQYRKSADGLVSLKGLIRNGVTTGGTIIANLPVGFRPSARILHNGVSSNAYARVDIESTTGNILFMTGNNTWLSLDGITFYAG